jgi:hypothetical protein
MAVNLFDQANDGRPSPVPMVISEQRVAAELSTADDKLMASRDACAKTCREQASMSALPPKADIESNGVYLTTNTSFPRK